MVDTIGVNGETPAPAPPRQPPTLPDVVEVTIAEIQQFPAPGTQRALKAELGRDYQSMVGPDADSADRTQTQVWVHLRKTVPGLRWEDCAEVAMQIADADAPVNPFGPSSSATSPDSVVSGG